MRLGVRFALMVLTAAVGACTINQLRVEEARTVAVSAKASTAATRVYLDQVDAARIRASLELVGLDPNCRDGAFNLRRPRIEQVRDVARPPRGWFCASTMSPATVRAPIRIGPIASDLEPTLALVDSLGAYGDALTEIVDAKAPDPGKKLADAFALARSAEQLLRTGIGGTAVVPKPDDPRLAAVTGFVTLIAQLDREQDQVRRLRLLADETESQQLIDALRSHLAQWEASRLSSAAVSRGAADILFSISAGIDPPLPSKVRRDFAAASFAVTAPAVQDAKLAPALDKALGEFADNDTAFRAALLANPLLDDRQKKRLAELTRQRLIAVFDSLTALILAAKGL